MHVLLWHSFPHIFDIFNVEIISSPTGHIREVVRFSPFNIVQGVHQKIRSFMTKESENRKWWFGDKGWAIIILTQTLSLQFPTALYNIYYYYVVMSNQRFLEIVWFRFPTNVPKKIECIRF